MKYFLSIKYILIVSLLLIGALPYVKAETIDPVSSPDSFETLKKERITRRLEASYQ